MKFKKILSATLAAVMAASVMSVGMVSVASAAVISSDATLTFSDADVQTYGAGLEADTDVPFVNDQFTCHFVGGKKSKIATCGKEVDGTTYTAEFRTGGKDAYIEFEIDKPATLTIGARSGGNDDATRVVTVYKADGTPLTPTYTPNALNDTTFTLSDPITLPEAGKYQIKNDKAINFFLVKVTFDGGSTTPTNGGLAIKATDDEKYVFVGIDDDTVADSITIDASNAAGQTGSGTITKVFQGLAPDAGVENPLSSKYIFAYEVQNINDKYTLTAKYGDDTATIEIGSESTTAATPEEPGADPTGYVEPGPYTFGSNNADFAAAAGDKNTTGGTFDFKGFLISIVKSEINGGYLALHNDNSVKFKVAQDSKAKITFSSHSIIVDGTTYERTNSPVTIDLKADQVYTITGDGTDNTHLESIEITAAQ